MGEALGRERKAARLAVTLLRAAMNDMDLVQAFRSHDYTVIQGLTPEVRKLVAEKCGYGHVSDETWERVIELLTERR
jgi:hypothetical protein